MLFFFIIIYFFIVFAFISIYEFIKLILIKKNSILNRPLNFALAKKIFINDLNKTKKEIIIQVGNGNLRFYGSREIFNEIVKKAEEGILISIISGNLLSGTKNPLVRLTAKNINIRLTIIKKAKNITPYFRIIDNRHVYLERPGLKDSDFGYYSYYKNNPYVANKLRISLDSLLSKN